jgi:hypothetical protein
MTRIEKTVVMVSVAMTLCGATVILWLAVLNLG